VVSIMMEHSIKRLAIAFSCLALSGDRSFSNGLIGYGIEMYDPSCAYACQHVLSRSPLNCSTPTLSDHGKGFQTSAECFASDNSFLLSLAWCLHQRCNVDEEEAWMIDRYWDQDIVDGDMSMRYDFPEAVEICGDGPSEMLVPGEPLDEPCEVEMEDWMEAERSMRDFAWTEKQHSTFGLALLALMILMPLVLTCAQSLTSAISPSLEKMLLSHLIHPPLFRERTLFVRLLGETESLTRGQALLILFVIIINLFFTTLGFRVSMPNIFFNSSFRATQVLVANRAGVLAFANLPVMILYICRSNPLIRLTRWPFSTFTLLHRWIGYICILQAAIHSLIYLLMHLNTLVHKFTQSYWNIGALGSIALLTMVPMSLLLVRRRRYELFIDVHIVLAIVVIVTCYYHIYCNFGYRWGYQNWILLTAFIWGLERAVRLVKMATNGVRTARVEEFDDEYMVVTVEGVKGTGMAYLYFPSLGWRVWENHPFSIMASVAEKRPEKISKTLEYDNAVFDLVGSDDESEDGDEKSHLNIDQKDTVFHSDDSDTEASFTNEKEYDSQLWPESQPAISQKSPHSTALTHLKSPQDDHTNFFSTSTTTQKNTITGLSFLIRREQGTTARLFTNTLSHRVLIEGAYPTTISHSTAVSTSAHVVCIAGGVGISAILPVLRARASAGVGRTAVYFGTRSEGLVRSCGLEELGTNGEAMGIDVGVKVGKRWDLREIVWEEAGCQGDEEIGTIVRDGRGDKDVMVIVCGPPEMVADVRWAVVEANRRRKGRGVVRLMYEAFG
jgi:NAD(P)H-flavin reductase